MNEFSASDTCRPTWRCLNPLILSWDCSGVEQAPVRGGVRNQICYRRLFGCHFSSGSNFDGVMGTVVTHLKMVQEPVAME